MEDAVYARTIDPTVAVVAPATAFFDYGAMAISYNHDPRRMPLQMGALSSLQAAAVGYLLQGDKSRARRERGLAPRSWWAVGAVCIAAAALLLICLLPPAPAVRSWT